MSPGARADDGVVPPDDAQIAALGTALQAEASVPGYRALALLGRGGQGAVYRAVQTSTGRTVALKLIRRDEVSTAAFERFRRERDLICLLRHPHIVSVLDAGVAGERQFLAMELVDGPTLEEWLNTAEQRTPAEVVRLLLPLCDAVAHAHRQGVTHRDLKPQNVLMQRMEDPTAPWAPKIVDFGLARVLEGSDPHFATARDQDRMSTLAYSAPELLSDGVAPPDTRIDVFGLGALLYRMLAGAPPRTGLTLEEARACAGPAPYRSIARHRTGGHAVGRDLEAIAFQAMSPSPDERYATVQDCAADLRRWLEGHPVAAVPRSLRYVFGKSLRRHRAAWTAGAVALLAAVGGLSAWGVQAAHTRQQSVRTVTALISHAREVDAIVLRLIEPIQRALGTDETTLGVVRELLATRERMIADNPGVVELVQGLLDLRREYGDLLNEADRKVEARAEFEAAAALLRTHFDVVGDPVLAADANVLRIRIGDSFMPADPVAALVHYEAALADDRARLAAYAGHPAAARFADDLAWSLTRIANVRWNQNLVNRRDIDPAWYEQMADECADLQEHLQADAWRSADVLLCEHRLRMQAFTARGGLEEHLPDLPHLLTAEFELVRAGAGSSLEYELLDLTRSGLIAVNAIHADAPDALAQASAHLERWDALLQRTNVRGVRLGKLSSLHALTAASFTRADAAPYRRAWLEEAVRIAEAESGEPFPGMHFPMDLARLYLLLAREVCDEDSARAVGLFAAARTQLESGTDEPATRAILVRRLLGWLQFFPPPPDSSAEYAQAHDAFRSALEQMASGNAE